MSVVSKDNILWVIFTENILSVIGNRYSFSNI